MTSNPLLGRSGKNIHPSIGYLRRAGLWTGEYGRCQRRLEGRFSLACNVSQATEWVLPSLLFHPHQAITQIDFSSTRRQIWLRHHEMSLGFLNKQYPPYKDEPAKLSYRCSRRRRWYYSLLADNSIWVGVAKVRFLPSVLAFIATADNLIGTY